MRKPRRLLKEHQVLQDLSQEQLEQALKFLALPTPGLQHLPQGLEQLNLVEWHLLQKLLENLLEEKQHHPLQ
jgi:hypothetical protein